MPKPHLALIAAIVLAFGLSHFSGQMDAYYLNVAIKIGIAVILAVSLNLVNGYTGQFSLGHAGFMSVGAYMSAVITMGLTIPITDLATVSGRFARVVATAANGAAQTANFVIVNIHALPEIPR